MGLNLHTIVRGAITFVHPDEDVLWYRSKGQVNASGKIVPVYAVPVTLACQVQSDSDEKLYFSNRVGENDITRVFYLLGERDARPAGIIRPQARNGDMIQRVEDGTWWLVVGVLEDFTGVEWCKVRVSMQVNAPDLTYSDVEEDEEGAETDTDKETEDGAVEEEGA